MTSLNRTISTDAPLPRLIFVLCVTTVMLSMAARGQDVVGGPLPGFRMSPWFGEQTSEERTPEGVKLLINAPAPTRMDPARPTLLVLYTTPNGSSIEQTMGSALAPGVDWHFDIQHVAAQIRRLREIDKRENIVLVCLEAEGRSWPTWRQRRPNSGLLIRELVSQLFKRIPGSPVRVALTGHSGGGSFIFGYLNGGATIPDYIERIGLLDADYSFDEAEGHAEKLLTWLNADAVRRLVVLAYDDRNVTLNSKPIVSPAGGTYRASHRMIDALGKDKPFNATTDYRGLFDRYEGLGGQAVVLIHKNPDNKILHSALVGEMNGLLFALTQGTPDEKLWGKFGGPRAYTSWLQPADFVVGTPVPSKPVELTMRTAGSAGAAAILSPLVGKPYADVEPLLVKQLLNGNIPDFLRNFKTIRVDAVDMAGKRHTAEFDVMPDYLAMGTDADFVRIPLSPTSGELVAKQFGCVLPTRKMVNDIYRHAEVRLDPIPLTQDRESLQTFIQHNSLIEVEREGKTPGLLVAGDKKDVVVTNRLQERPNRVAIYGWQRLDGFPIQPLTIVHRESYVDYSHGIRLVRAALLVDGKPMSVADVLRDPVLNVLLSDEGPIEHPGYTPQ